MIRLDREFVTSAERALDSPINTRLPLHWQTAVFAPRPQPTLIARTRRRLWLAGDWNRQKGTPIRPDDHITRRAKARLDRERFAERVTRHINDELASILGGPL